MADQLVPDPPYVLLVESDQALRERLGTALYASGFVPLLAADATDAVHYMAGVRAVRLPPGRDTRGHTGSRNEVTLAPGRTPAPYVRWDLMTEATSSGRSLANV